MGIFEVIIYVIIGVCAGFLAGLLGIGGGLVTVPLLLTAFNLSAFPEKYMMHVALGTSLAAMVITSFSSGCSHWKKGGVNWCYFRLLAPGVVLGTVAGAAIADFLPGKSLELVFGYGVSAAGLYFLLSPEWKRLKEKPSDYIPSGWVFLLGGVIIGGISAILGIGGGIMTVPFLAAFHTPLRNAISTSAALGFIIAVAGAVSYLSFGLFTPTFNGAIGFVYIPAFIVIGVVAAAFAPLGAKMAYTFPTKILSKIFGVYLVIVGITMIWH